MTPLAQGAVRHPPLTSPVGGGEHGENAAPRPEPRGCAARFAQIDLRVSEFETKRTGAKYPPSHSRSPTDTKPVVKGCLCGLAELFGRGNADSAGAFVEYSDTLKECCPTMPACAMRLLLEATAPLPMVQASWYPSVSSSSINIVVEKHAPTPKLQPKAFDALFAFAQNGSAEQVHSALISGSAHKVPKVRAAAAKALAAVVAKLGGKSLDLKAVGGVMLGLIEHRDKAVRDEGLTLLGELRLARGDAAVFNTLKSLPKDKQVTAEKAEALMALPKPERAAAATASGAAAADQGEAAAVPAFDLLGALPGKQDKWLKQLSAEKWGERKAAPDQLLAILAEHPRIQPGEYTEVVKGLKRLLSDANAAVTSSAVKAMGGARGGAWAGGRLRRPRQEAGAVPARKGRRQEAGGGRRRVPRHLLLLGLRRPHGGARARRAAPRPPIPWFSSAHCSGSRQPPPPCRPPTCPRRPEAPRPVLPLTDGADGNSVPRPSTPSPLRAPLLSHRRRRQTSWPTCPTRRPRASANCSEGHERLDLRVDCLYQYVNLRRRVGSWASAAAAGPYQASSTIRVDECRSGGGRRRRALRLVVAGVGIGDVELPPRHTWRGERSRGQHPPRRRRLFCSSGGQGGNRRW